MSLSGSVFITGAGTLANAIVRTAEAELWSCDITIYSRSEQTQALMKRKHPQCRYVLGDIRDYDRLSAAIAGHDMVIHTAAMKMIPECEAQPTECIATNVGGSINVARACIAAGVQRCVGLSTDKACCSVTTYGASKRLLEGVFTAANGHGTTFTLCRYGNVVASRGSVIPLWREQAARDGMLTITDKRMTRFWMSEEDAVLTVELAALLDPGECIVPKMAALGIVEMAAILHPGMPTREIGLRSREKLHEDLVHRDEPARELIGHYVLGSGSGGICYSSDIAPHLAADRFLHMLEIAETNEVAAC